MSQQQVYEWSMKFANGVTSVEDAPRPGQAQRVVTPQNITAVEAIVMENRRVTMNDIAACLKISHGSAHHTVHDVLQFHKVSARWVPRQLTPELRERRVDACEELLRRFEREGDGFLARIVTGGRNLGSLPPTGNEESEQGMTPFLITKTKEVSNRTISREGYADFFWDEKRVILEHYTPRWTTVTSASYSDLLKNHPRPAIKSKRRGLLSSGVL